MGKQRRKDRGEKKPFIETKVGAFLAGTGSDILNLVGEVLPDQGWMGIVKNLITRDTQLSESQKEMAYRLLEADMAEMRAITGRWEADMSSDNWLSKNVRPASLVFLTIMMVTFIFLDSYGDGFVVEEAWIDLLKTLLITVYFAYFGSRGWEKSQTIVGKYKQMGPH